MSISHDEIFNQTSKQNLRDPSYLKLVVLLALMSFAHEAIAQETRRVRFAVTNPPHFLPIWLAKDTGIFSKHGLDVEVIFMRGGALITMGILSGELQLSGVGEHVKYELHSPPGEVLLSRLSIQST